MTKLEHLFELLKVAGVEPSNVTRMHVDANADGEFSLTYTELLRDEQGRAYVDHSTNDLAQRTIFRTLYKIPGATLSITGDKELLREADALWSSGISPTAEVLGRDVYGNWIVKYRKGQS